MSIDTDIIAAVPENWTIIKHKAFSHVSADAHLRIVLAARKRRGFNPHGEFVTWVANLTAPECFEGHYFGEFLPALRDYAARGVQVEATK